MGDLNSTETLHLVSNKLPSYSAVKWCQHAHQAQTKSMKIVTFSNLRSFKVKEEAKLPNDPIFSPDALKAERKETDTQTRLGWRSRQNKGSKGLARADSFVTTTIHLQNSSFLRQKLQRIKSIKLAPFAMASMPFSHAANFWRVQ